MKHLPFLLLALLSFAASALAQNSSMRNTLGTRLTATPEAIILDWDPKHPWSADIARGASLMAEYATTSQGVVLQALAQGKITGANASSMRFILPSALTVPPTGPVCLFVKLSNNRILPIRTPGANHADPSLFRDQFWEQAAIVRTGTVEQKRFLSEMQAAADKTDHEVEQARTALLKKGWTEAAGCQNVASPSFAAARPADVIPLEQQEEAARRACTTRALRAQLSIEVDVDNIKDPEKLRDEVTADLTKFAQPPALLEFLLKQVQSSGSHGDEASRKRQQQLAAYEQDWSRYSKDPDIKQPLLGDENDRIELQSLTTGSGLAIRPLLFSYLIHQPVPAGIHIDPADVVGFVGGNLEAYSRCVVDSQAQLRSKLEEWEANQANAPRLSEMAHKELVESCQKDASALSALLTQQKALHDRLQQQQNAHPAPQETTTSSAGQPDQVLNNVVCAVK